MADHDDYIEDMEQKDEGFLNKIKNLPQGYKLILGAIAIFIFYTYQVQGIKIQDNYQILIVLLGLFFLLSFTNTGSNIISYYNYEEVRAITARAVETGQMNGQLIKGRYNWDSYRLHPNPYDGNPGEWELGFTIENDYDGGDEKHYSLLIQSRKDRGGEGGLLKRDLPYAGEDRDVKMIPIPLEKMQLYQKHVVT
tara:strand:+ start:11974 stop:12558 length:585 start_codon:yes stop_codon:yes gene_type:complete